jgi:hypothetical protein
MLTGIANATSLDKLREETTANTLLAIGPTTLSSSSSSKVKVKAINELETP